MEPIHGRDCLVSLKVEDEFLELLCATDFTLTVAQELVLATTIGSGAWRRKRLRGLSDWNIELNGLTKINNDDGKIAWFYVLQQQVRGTTQIVQIIFEDSEGNDQVLEGEVVIPEMSLSSSVSDFVGASILLEGSGPFEIQNVIPVPTGECEEDYADTWVAVEGENTITGNGDVLGLSFAGAIILLVEREGLSHDPTDGTPGNRQYSYDGTTITFNPSNPFIDGERVRVIWKIEAPVS